METANRIVNLIAVSLPGLREKASILSQLEPDHDAGVVAEVALVGVACGK